MEKLTFGGFKVSRRLRGVGCVVATGNGFVFSLDEANTFAQTKVSFETVDERQVRWQVGLDLEMSCNLCHGIVLKF